MSILSLTPIPLNDDEGDEEMKITNSRFWRIFNIGSVILAIKGGYDSLAPERLKTTNPDGILCLIILVVMT
jgi:hypothetical protein